MAREEVLQAFLWRVQGLEPEEYVNSCQWPYVSGYLWPSDMVKNSDVPARAVASPPRRYRPKRTRRVKGTAVRQVKSARNDIRLQVEDRPRERRETHIPEMWLGLLEEDRAILERACFRYPGGVMVMYSKVRPTLTEIERQEKDAVLLSEYKRLVALGQTPP